MTSTTSVHGQLMTAGRTTASLGRLGHDVPAAWPPALHPRMLKGISQPTPYLVSDINTVRDRYKRFTAAIPGVQPFYAVKCNPTPQIAMALRDLGSSFEVASFPELQMLMDNGVDAGQVLYSNTVKPPEHVAKAYAAGLWRFAVDSSGELRKLAQHAPGSAVYVRLRVDDSESLFPLSRKFGAEASKARTLLNEAVRLGLRPYGLTFHVGSQCTNASAWGDAIAEVNLLMTDLLADGIRLEMLNVGGGFPARYLAGVPTIEAIGEVITEAVAALPYRPDLLAAEPGRHLSAEAGVMVATVLGRDIRAGENWLYLDVGAYNGLMETQQTSNRWRFPLWSSRPDHAFVPKIPFTVTGPSCDSSDTMFYNEMLPSSLEAGDKLYIGCAGAYSLSYASHFNGFAPPAAIFVGQ